MTGKRRVPLGRSDARAQVAADLQVASAREAKKGRARSRTAYNAELEAGIDRLRDDVLCPLAEHRPAAYRRYDWFTGSLAETVRVPAADHLIVEGCGSAARRTATAAGTVLWVETDDTERLARGLARDGDEARPHWLRWMAGERAHYTAEATRDRADLRLDGHGNLVP